MGSRGQALKSGGFSVYKYKTLMRYNNVRFVMQKETTKSIKVPEMSNSKWAVYATISKKGELQSISFFNGSRKKYKEIDLIQAHHKLLPHVHNIDPNAIHMRDESNYRALTKKESNRVKSIKDFFYKHHLKELYQKEILK